MSLQFACTSPLFGIWKLCPESLGIIRCFHSFLYLHSWVQPNRDKSVKQYAGFLKEQQAGDALIVKRENKLIADFLFRCGVLMATLS